MISENSGSSCFTHTHTKTYIHTHTSVCCCSCSDSENSSRKSVMTSPLHSLLLMMSYSRSHDSHVIGRFSPEAGHLHLKWSHHWSVELLKRTPLTSQHTHTHTHTYPHTHTHPHTHPHTHTHTHYLRLHEAVLWAGNEYKYINFHEICHFGHIQFPHCHSVVLCSGVEFDQCQLYIAGERERLTHLLSSLSQNCL